jgi:chromosome segregation ATPase
VSQSEPSHLKTLQAEISQLQEELELRDQLVDQLSQELFRLVKDNSNWSSPQTANQEYTSQLERLQAQIADIEEQVQFYQKQIATRDQEIYQLQSKIQTLTDKNQTLEKMLQDLPELYREKFAQRMKPVKEKVQQLQRENQQLQAQVQTLTYRLTIRNRSAHEHDIDLPNLKQGDPKL